MVVKGNTSGREGTAMILIERMGRRREKKAQGEREEME